MKTLLSATLLTLVVFAAAEPAMDPVLPPPDMKLKEGWATLEKKSFHEWKIGRFVGWTGVADGGSVAFEFLTDQGVEFDVLVANPAYWTDADKEAKRQVIYLIVSGRFYLLIPASEQENHLLRILTDAATIQKGEGRADPKYINALIEKMKDRRAMENHWPMTKKEADDAIKSFEKSKDAHAQDPFE